MHDWRPPERLDSILDDCIDHLDTETPEELLRSYPHSAPELAPLLHVAAELAEMGDLQMPAAAREAGRARLRAAVLTQQRRRRPRPIAQRALRMATWAALLLVVFGTGLSAVTVASASALPNDRQYGWKRASERVWVGIQPSTEQTVEAALWVADRRVAEMQLLYQRDG